jgi:succinyl-diaminopimelate desuccinylase
MKLDFKKLVKPYEKESVSKLQEYIKIDSVNDMSTAKEGQPFGEGVKNALDYMAKLGKEEGFEVDTCEGYCTELTYGTGDKMIGIFAHADVVPATGEWKHGPFDPVIEDDVMYGRGTSDDKGPGLAAFYAVKALKDNGLIDGYKVRLVYGGDEELGGRCLEHYFHVLNKPSPTYGFTPDAEFPLIYGEKGIGGYIHEYELKNDNIISLNGGTAANIVIDEATALVKKEKDLDRQIASYFKLIGVNFTIKESPELKDVLEVKVFGKAAHGSTPEYGINAGLLLIKFLGHHYGDDALEKLSDNYIEPTGKKLGAYYESEFLHNSTYNVGIIKTEGRTLKLTVNFRYPENVDLDDACRKINAQNIGKVESIKGGKPLLFDPKSPMVTTLLKAYQEESGDYETPAMTIGGGTYAKECENTIAFGSHFPGRADNIHSPNENIHLEDYLSSQYIYARAIYDLGKLEK